MERTQCKGVMERKNKNGTTSYTINYYGVDGKKKTKMVGNSKKDKMTPNKASKIRDNLVAELKIEKDKIKNNSINKTEYEVGELTLDECFEKYYTPEKQRFKSFKGYKMQYYGKISPLIGSTKIKDLTIDHRLKIENEYHNKIKVVTIEHYLTIPSALINNLIERNLYKERNPFKWQRGKKPKQANYRREGKLTITEFKNLLEEIKINYSTRKHFNDVLLFLEIAITTGGRVKTILNIKTEDIEIDGKFATVILRENKTLTNVKAYLNTDLTLQLKTLKHYSKGINTKIFKMNYLSLLRFLTPIFEELFNSKLDKKDKLYDYKKICIHSLRHSFANLLIDQKVNLIHIQKLMGHKKIETTAKYVTSNEEDRKEAVTLLMNKIALNNVFDDFNTEAPELNYN